VGQINKIPLGYLNMLGSQTGGKNPFNSLEEVLPMVDMVPFYHAQAMKCITASYTPSSLLDSQFVRVPDDEAWMVYGVFNRELTISASDSVRWQNVIGGLPKSGLDAYTCYCDGVLLQNTASTALLASGINFPVPIPLQAGGQVSQVFADGAGNRASTLMVLAAVFKA
jgi:hypothetical protein